MGPGTHILERLRDNVMPVNQSDAASMIHDVEYLSPFISEELADKTAISNNGSLNMLNPGNTISQIAMRIGFTTKDIFGGYNSHKNYQQYKDGMRLLKKQQYQDIINKYNLKFSTEDIKFK